MRGTDRGWHPAEDGARSRQALRLLILLLALAAVLVAVVRLAHAETPAQTVPVRQIWVIDGDTLDVLVPTKDRIRIEGIDAPETYRPHCEAERAKGLAAKREAIRLVRAGREATIVRHGTDRYGRTLGTVAIDGIDLGASLTALGLALPYQPGSDAKAARITHWCGPGEW